MFEQTIHGPRYLNGKQNGKQRERSPRGWRFLGSFLWWTTMPVWWPLMLVGLLVALPFAAVWELWKDSGKEL